MKSFILYATLAISLGFDLVSAGHINHRREKHLGHRACKGNHSGSNSTLSSTVSSVVPSSTPNTGNTDVSSGGSNPSSSGGFPSLGFQMPSSVPKSLDGWWTNMDDEIAFLGFSYEVTACQSASKLQSDFKDIRTRFKGRYIRLYGACDKAGFYDDIIDAAWDNTLGVHALVWFGFDGGSKWKPRRDSLFNTLKTNPKAPFVTRAVQFGSEPLFDSVLSPSALAQQVKDAKQDLASVKIPVTVSDMAYGYQSHGGAQEVLDAVDFFDVHILPFFGHSSSTGAAAWPFVESDMNFFVKNGKGKKIIFTENGWPSQETSSLKPNSPKAHGTISNEEGYFSMLDSHCEDFKAVKGGGVGWFAHMYSDEMELGYGILNTQGKLKFNFSPRTSC